MPPPTPCACTSSMPFPFLSTAHWSRHSASVSGTHLLTQVGCAYDTTVLARRETARPRTSMHMTTPSCELHRHDVTKLLLMSCGVLHAQRLHLYSCARQHTAPTNSACGDAPLWPAHLCNHLLSPTRVYVAPVLSSILVARSLARSLVHMQSA